MSNLDTPINNTPYSKEELEHFKELLLEEKKKAEEEIETMKDTVERLESNDQDVKSAISHHEADIATEEEEKETLFKLIGREKDKITRIKGALDRIELGTYGVCQDTGKKIQKERLEAIPYTAYCIEAREGDDEVEQNKPPQV